MDTRNEHRPDRGGEHHPAALATHGAPPEHVASEPAATRAEGEHGPPRWPKRHPSHPLRLHAVHPAVMAEKLRSALGLPPSAPTPGETAAAFGRPIPPVVHGLDVGGWIAWCMVGLLLFGERFPSLAAVRHESKRVAATLAMLRACGNISKAAVMLGASRKVLRENLRAAGLYDDTSNARAKGSDARGGDSP